MCNPFSQISATELPFFLLFFFPSSFFFLAGVYLGINLRKFRQISSVLPQTEIWEKPVFLVFRNDLMIISQHFKNIPNIGTRTNVLMEMCFMRSILFCLPCENKLILGRATNPCKTHRSCIIR